MATTKVMIVGLGPIGAGVARQLAARRNFRIVAAVDVDPAKAGRDVGEIAALGRRTGVRVLADVGAAIRRAAPQAAVLCTSSSLAAAAPLIEAILRRRVPIVSTTEELAYPWRSNRRLARRLDAAAKKARVALVGTGINPGFAMDALPITLTAICERVDAVRVERVQDARIRRLPFQKKIGSGLTAAEFAEKVKAGSVRHVGLTESVSMIADALGWKLDRVSDEIQPKLARARVDSPFLEVEAGQVCGIVQDGTGYRGGKAVISLHMEAYLGAPETFDAVTIEGSPRLCVKAQGGYHGDIATAAIAVNTIPRVLAAPPGLHTMRSLALPSFAGAR
jgi:hypothetical protein